MKAAEMMSGKPVWIDLTQSLAEAEGLMKQEKTDGLLVRDAAGRAVGVLTRQDLEAYQKQRLEHMLDKERGAPPHHCTLHMRPEEERVERWISPRIVSIREDASLLLTVREMFRWHVDRIFVISRKHDHYKGVITFMDVFKSLVRTGAKRGKD